MTTTPPRRYAFRWIRSYRLSQAPLGINPSTAWVELSQDTLSVRFGAWRLRTPLSNITGTERTGGFGFFKTAGPPHLSFSDRGVTFATNPDLAVCLRFARPVKGIDPTGIVKHPGATISVLDVDGFLDGLVERGVSTSASRTAERSGDI